MRSRNKKTTRERTKKVIDCLFWIKQIPCHIEKSAVMKENEWWLFPQTVKPVESSAFITLSDCDARNGLFSLIICVHNRHTRHRIDSESHSTRPLLKHKKPAAREWIFRRWRILSNVFNHFFSVPFLFSAFFCRRHFLIPLQTVWHCHALGCPLKNTPIPKPSNTTTTKIRRHDDRK